MRVTVFATNLNQHILTARRRTTLNRNTCTNCGAKVCAVPIRPCPTIAFLRALLSSFPFKHFLSHVRLCISAANICAHSCRRVGVGGARDQFVWACGDSRDASKSKGLFSLNLHTLPSRDAFVLLFFCEKSHRNM